MYSMYNDCSTTWIEQSSCSVTEKCSSGVCIYKTCNDFTGTYGSCSNEDEFSLNINRLYVYQCKDQISTGGDLLCLEKISNLGDSDFCENMVYTGNFCQLGEYQCSLDSQCANGLTCTNGYCSEPEEEIEYCTGDFQVYIEDNVGSAQGGILVTEDKLSRTQTTDVFGQTTFSYTNIDCHEKIEFTATCSDEVTLCGVKDDDIDDEFESIKFDCSMCVPDKKDLSFDRSSLVITDNSVSIDLTSVNIEGLVYVSLYLQDETGLRDEDGVEVEPYIILKNQNNEITFTGLDLSDIEYIHLYIDEEDDVDEENEDNNYIFSAVQRDEDVYLEVDFGEEFSILNNITREYLSSYFNLVDEAHKDLADYHVVIGDAAVSEYKSIDELILERSLADSDNPLGEPYNAVIQSNQEYVATRNVYRPLILVHGLQLQGTVAGVKRLINAKNMFFDKGNYLRNAGFTDIIDDYDKLGIQTMDLLSKDRLGNHLSANDEVLRSAVEDIYYGNNMEVSIKPVRIETGSSNFEPFQMRVKNLNTDYSQAYKDAFGISANPIVMSGGIFSDITSFEDFGKDLVSDGYNVWLIEMNGGPETDCPGLEGDDDTCPNYTFEEEAYIHWPAAIAGVMAYSETDEVDYIGHSNGGRTALFGLNAYSQNGLNNAGEILNFTSGNWEYADLPSHPVGKFFGIGVPSTLNGETKFTNLARNYGDVGLNAIQNKNHTHMYEYAYPMLTEDSIFKYDNDPVKYIVEKIMYFALVKASTEPLSENVMEFYHNLAYDNETEIDLSDIYIDGLYLLNGNESDYIVPYSDGLIILDSATNVDNKDIKPINSLPKDHIFIKKNTEVINYIKEKLK